jgi:hypothetical protein
MLLIGEFFDFGEKFEFSLKGYVEIVLRRPKNHKTKEQKRGSLRYQ